MKKYPPTAVCLIAALFVSLLPHPLRAQTYKGELKEGEPVTFELPKDQVHQFAMELDRDQYVWLKLTQQGIDVLINTFDPEGNELGTFDTPNGRYGPEYVTIQSDTPGRYTLEVRPFDQNQVTGRYDLEVLKSEPKAVTREGRVDQLFALWDNDHTPGAAIAIVQQGEIVYKNGYGMSNLEYDIPITPSTVFHIASVSKQFTAFSVLLLEKDGLLSLEDDVRKYIPEVPDFGKIITLRHLAHHTSGLRDQWNLLALAGWRLDDVITREQILKLVSKQQALNFDPGEEYLYCNTGFTLLAEVVARVSGQSFPEFAEERIFRPLHMEHTLFYDDHERIVKNRAYSYAPDSTGYKKSVLSYANVGATSLFTTVEDLSLWAMNFEDPVVGDADLILRLRTRGVLNNGDTIGYALGQSLFKYRGLDVIGHGGADAGYRTNITRVPGQKFSVIVFSNNGGFNPAGIANKVMDIYLADAFPVKQTLSEQASREQTSTESPEDAGELTHEPVMDPDTLQAYLGDYELQPGVIIKILMEEGNMLVRVAGMQDARLRPLSTYEFELEGADVKASFHRDESNRVNEIQIIDGGQIFSAARLEPFHPELVDLSEYEGQFYSDELSTSYEVVNENGILVAKHQRHSDIKLTPVKRDGFSGNTWFFGALDFVRDASGTITGCRVSSGRVRNVYFRKTARLPQ